jgi:thiol-disulfide isomerase/thioredoxin
MKLVRLDYPTWQSHIVQLQQTHHTLYLYFFGTEETDTGASWCPDCRDADPVIKQFVQTLGDEEGRVVVHLPAGTRPEYSSCIVSSGIGGSPWITFTAWTPI